MFKEIDLYSDDGMVKAIIRGEIIEYDCGNGGKHYIATIVDDGYRNVAYAIVYFSNSNLQWFVCHNYF